MRAVDAYDVVVVLGSGWKGGRALTTVKSLPRRS